MLYLCYLCRFKPLRDHLRGFLIAAWAGDKIAEFSFPEISFHFPLRPWFFFVSPAYAGKSPLFLTRRGFSKDHPRVCGEKDTCSFSSSPRTGSPPRMRGKADWKQQFPRASGSPPRMRGKGHQLFQPCVHFWITPAYAGKSLLKHNRSNPKTDHPRVCGEKVSASVCFCAGLGSPPRMRGKVIKNLHLWGGSGITPAYAGKRISFFFLLLTA